MQRPEIPKALFNYSTPVEKVTLDNCERILLAKEERHLYTEKRRGWIYDNPQLRKDCRSGAYRVDSHRLYHHFENWVEDASITYIRNMQTGEKVRKLAPKRGNKAYAANYKKRMNALTEAIANCQLDEPFGSTGKYFKTKAILVTFTYKQADISLQAAWANVSSDLAKWKIQAKRKLGIKSIATLAIKEGTQSGYPAPHMLILLSSPVIVHRHESAKGHGITWRLHSLPILDSLKNSWHRGFIDVQGIINKKVSNGNSKVSIVRYLFKYLTKAIDTEPSEEPNNSIREKYRNIGIKTFAWQKLFMLRPLHISKAFKDTVRLDTPMRQSQHGIWYFDHADRCKLADAGYILQSSMPPDPFPYPLIGPDHGKPVRSIWEQIEDMHRFTAAGGLITLEAEEFYLQFGHYPLITKQ